MLNCNIVCCVCAVFCIKLHVLGLTCLCSPAKCSIVNLSLHIRFIETNNPPFFLQIQQIQHFLAVMWLRVVCYIERSVIFLALRHEPTRREARTVRQCPRVKNRGTEEGAALCCCLKAAHEKGSCALSWDFGQSFNGLLPVYSLGPVCLSVFGGHVGVGKWAAADGKTKKFIVKWSLSQKRKQCFRTKSNCSVYVHKQDLP